MSVERDRGYVRGATESVLHVLEEFVEQHRFVANDADLAERLSRAIMLLRDFLFAADMDSEKRFQPPVVLVPGEPLDPATIELMAGLPESPEPLHHMFLPRWQQRDRAAISVTEAAKYIVDVVIAARDGAEITLTLDGKKSAKLVPYKPAEPVSKFKPFDPQVIRGYAELLAPHDVPAAQIVRETRNRDRY